MVNEGAGQRPSPAAMLRMLFGMIAVVALVLGYVGLATYLRQRPDLGRSVADLTYYDLQLFVMDSVPLDRGGPYPLTLEIARFAAPAVTVYALIDAIYVLFSDRLRRFRIRRLRGHHVVCGTSPAARVLAERLRATGERVVTVSPQDDGDLGVGHHHLVGDPSQTRMLQWAGAHRARVLYAFSDDSAANARVALTAQRLHRNRREPLIAYMYVADPDLCQGLRARRLGLAQGPGFRLDFFNPAQLAARAFLEENPLKQEDRRVLIVGLTPFGREVAVELARQRQMLTDAGRGVMTLVDPDASRIVAELEARYAFLREWDLNVIDCETTEFEAGALESPERTFLCQHEAEEALRLALTAVGLWRNTAGQIVVSVDQSATYGQAFAVQPGGPLLDGLSGQLTVQGIFDTACDPARIGDDLIEQFARAMHEHYVRDRIRQGETRWVNTSLVPWRELPETLRNANRSQATDIGRKLAAITATLAPRVDAAPHFSFTADELERLARMEHIRWAREREREGWSHGPLRDNDRRLHPDLVEWQNLSEEAKSKDLNAIRVLPEILADAGFQIVRLPPPD